jgi:hypothetical protein
VLGCVKVGKAEVPLTIPGYGAYFGGRDVVDPVIAPLLVIPLFGT